MKTLHLSIIVILIASSIIISQNVFAQQTAKEILQERDDAKKTGLEYNGTMLIVTQEINKTKFKTGENFSVTPHLVNVGTNVATITHGEPLFEIKVLDQNNNTSFIWPDATATIGITETLEPGMSITGRWASGYGGFPEIVLDKPGNYTVYSIANINSEGIPAHMESIWSQPLAITILSANYTSQTNSTNSIPPNAIKIPDGGGVTPLQTTTQNGSNLTIHYETGVDVTGKIMPTGPQPQFGNPSVNKECVDKIMAQEQDQDTPINNDHALELAKSFPQFALQTFGHNYTLNRIYHDFDINSCTVTVKDVVVEFVEKNSTGDSLMTVTEDLGLDKVIGLNVSKINNSLVTGETIHYMSPAESPNYNMLIFSIAISIGVVASIVLFFKMKRKK
ncbi:MAG: hypothetical protein ACREAR_06805 [Nitrosotalea sp.]